MGQVALAPDIDEEIPRSYFRFGCRAFEAEGLPRSRFRR